MTGSKALRWFVRMAWLATVVIVYRSLNDFGPQGEGRYTVHMLVMFAIYAAGDALLEWRWSRAPEETPEREVSCER